MKSTDFRALHQTDCVIVTFHEYFISQYIGCLVSLLLSGRREGRNYEGDRGVLVTGTNLLFTFMFWDLSMFFSVNAN